MSPLLPYLFSSPRTLSRSPRTSHSPLLALPSPLVTPQEETQDAVCEWAASDRTMGSQLSLSPNATGTHAHTFTLKNESWRRARGVWASGMSCFPNDVSPEEREKERERERTRTSRREREKERERERERGREGG